MRSSSGAGRSSAAELLFEDSGAADGGLHAGSCVLPLSRPGLLRGEATAMPLPPMRVDSGGCGGLFLPIGFFVALLGRLLPFSLGLFERGESLSEDVRGGDAAAPCARRGVEVTLPSSRDALGKRTQRTPTASACSSGDMKANASTHCETRVCADGRGPPAACGASAAKEAAAVGELAGSAAIKTSPS